MTKEDILEHIELLKKEREGVKNTLFAYDGAIQDCHYWLKKLEDQEKE